MSQFYAPDLEHAESVHIRLMQAAKANGTFPALEAAREGLHSMLRTPTLWPIPDSVELDERDMGGHGLLHNAPESPLTEYVRSLCASIKFPENTAFLHGLGIVSSAMNFWFQQDYYGTEKPCNLYIITAQPPSTGKSGINGALASPVRETVHEMAERNVPLRRKILSQIAKLEKDLDKAGHDNEIADLCEQIAEKTRELQQYPVWVYSVDDATPEALEQIAGNQGGIFNVVSDEADAVNIMLGNVYGDKKTNHGLFLKAWDGDYHSPARITRETKPGHFHGSIAVIAQDESITSILEAGRSGRGISERILLYREPNLLGSRDHTKYVPVCQTKRTQYHDTIKAITDANERIVLRFSPDAISAIQNYRNTLERQMGDDGVYASSMLRGAVGKADKQIRKLACSLHALDQWRPGGGRSRTVGVDTVASAIMIYSSLIETYVETTNDQGYAGESAELAELIKYIEKQAAKGKLKITRETLRGAVKNNSVFAGRQKLSTYLKEALLPALERSGHLIQDSATLYLNPHLK